jgi:hypothetical protein
MARSFLNALTQFIKMIPYETHTKIPIQFQISGLGVVIGGHACYAYGSQKTGIIRINRSYMYTQNGGTEFMVIDQNGKHYNVNNSFWYWKWNSIEDWHKMEMGDVIHVKYYGYRIPIFGMFPNIVYSRNIREPIQQEPPFEKKSIYESASSVNVLM